MVFFRVGFAAKFASSAFDSIAAFNKEPSLKVKFRLCAPSLTTNAPPAFITALTCVASLALVVLTKPPALGVW